MATPFPRLSRPRSSALPRPGGPAAVAPGSPRSSWCPASTGRRLVLRWPASLHGFGFSPAVFHGRRRRAASCRRRAEPGGALVAGQAPLASRVIFVLVAAGPSMGNALGLTRKDAPHEPGRVLRLSAAGYPAVSGGGVGGILPALRCLDAAGASRHTRCRPRPRGPALPSGRASLRHFRRLFRGRGITGPGRERSDRPARPVRPRSGVVRAVGLANPTCC